GDDEVGEKRQHPADAGDGAGDGGDDGGLGLPQLLEQLLVVDGEVAVVEGREILGRISAGGDVRARAEVAPVAGEDYGPHGAVGISPVQQRSQRVARVGVDGVAAVGPV